MLAWLVLGEGVEPTPDTHRQPAFHQALEHRARDSTLDEVPGPHHAKGAQQLKGSIGGGWGRVQNVCKYE